MHNVEVLEVLRVLEVLEVRASSSMYRRVQRRMSFAPMHSSTFGHLEHPEHVEHFGAIFPEP